MCQKTAPVWEKDSFILRLAREGDFESYYSQNYVPLDPEVARFTGSKPSFCREEVLAFFQSSLQDEDRYLFLLISPEGRILGESVVNQIDSNLRSANFRIALFHSAQRGRGLGTWMTETVRDFAFGQLGLHRLELDVYSFNPRAIRVYEKAGFRREGVLRDAVADREGYGDDILMAILEDEWKRLKQGEVTVWQ